MSSERVRPQGPVQRIDHGGGSVSYVWPPEYIGSLSSLHEMPLEDLDFILSYAVDYAVFTQEYVEITERKPST